MVSEISLECAYCWDIVEGATEVVLVIGPVEGKITSGWAMAPFGDLTVRIAHPSCRADWVNYRDKARLA